MSSESALQKQAKQNSEGLANAPTKKKIGFFSAMMIAVGSCIGAGIFFKAKGVLDNTANSLILAIFTWLIAAFAVIAMALALVEIASARNDNLSLIGWSQTFNGKIVYKACKNFMVYIYLPLTYFFMPLYVIMSIQDGIAGFIGRDANIGNGGWAIMMAIAIVMSVYFIVVCGFSSKAGNIQNWIITSVKFIPLVLAVVLGFWAFADNGGNIVNTAVQGGLQTPATPAADATTFSFAKLTPGFGMFIAIAAIFFAYDGFYVAAGLQSEMKEPKKTPLALLFGLALVTIIYILIAVAMSLGSADGGPFGFQEWLTNKGLNWLYGLFQLLIGIGVLGIINGFALWSTRFVEDLILSNEVPFSKKLAPKINKKYPIVGIIYNLVLSLPIVVIFCIVGGLGYIDAVGYGTGYGQGVGELYSFADLMSTWVSVLAFAFIVFAIAGALRNRKTNAIKVEKTKYFIPMAICCIIIVSISLFFTFFEPIADLFMIYQVQNVATDVLVSRIMKVVILLLFVALMIAPIFIENAMNKKKYGSLERADLENAKVMAQIKGHSLKKEVLENLMVSRRITLESWECQALGQKELTAEQIKMINNSEVSDEADDMARDSKEIAKEVSKKLSSSKKVVAKSTSKSKSSK
ncbi:MAG: APC family permease [Ureaplasma sp.]|nr:APC family permease [Ureaplasma sp.]MDE7221993.1 APC family permease [Ureaplasma sp.]